MAEKAAKAPSYDEMFSEDERKVFFDCFVIPVLGENATPEQIETAHYLHGIFTSLNTQFALVDAVAFFQKMEAGMKFMSAPQFIQMLREDLPKTRKKIELVFKNAQLNNEMLNRLLRERTGKKGGYQCLR